MKFKYLMVLFILLLFSSNATSSSSWCWNNGQEYGYYMGVDSGSGVYADWRAYHSSGHAVYMHYMITTAEGRRCALRKFTGDAGCGMGSETHVRYIGESNTYEEGVYYISSGSSARGAIITEWDCPPTFVSTVEIIISPLANLTNFTVSGNLDCISQTELYIKNGYDNYVLKETNTSSSYYEFKIINGFDYKLNFSDGHEYEFTCNDNIIYDRDICSWITLNFRDNCGNLITDTTGYWYTPEEFLPQSFISPSGSYDVLFENQDYIELWVMSHIGELYYNITNPEDITYSINNPTISWNNNIFVKDLNNSIIIEDALVTFNQDCIIDNSLYPSRNKYTNIDGYAIFDQCELDMSHITVTKDGYKPFSGSISPIHLNALKSCQTTIVNLYPVDDALNESEYTSTSYNTYIYFKDVNGSITNSILDSDDYVDLYYYNNNSDGVSMTLQFYKTNIYTGKTGLLSWNIPYDESGYKRILKTNYTQTNYGYYGYLYSHSIDGWNIKKRLTVSNNTIEVIDHYQNLTKGLWFVNKNSNHSIDYRNEIKIVAYAKSNYSFLHNITLKLYDNNVLIESIVLDVFDFITADIENYYEWNLGYNYTLNHNYTIEMYGYDDTFLKLDYINAIDLRKNKLTIIVKDRGGDTLINSYIFLEGYGSLPTGINYYNSYEGLDNGNYRYKASKSGYTSYGWDIINIIDSDNTVTYVLCLDSESYSASKIKMEDNDLQKIFVSLITILIIFILLGGLTHVAK